MEHSARPSHEVINRRIILTCTQTRLSGKPGSGKSTLMKYVSTEFRKFCESEAVSHWINDENLVICSFFFWNTGSPSQKNYVGLLRSLLFQIAEQRRDLVPIMMGDDTTTSARRSEAHEPGLMYAWTKERLDKALQRLLAKKPPSIRVCMFIDGLDEFEGDEDSLMDIIRLLSRNSHTKVCVSSRPEQMFRQGFANSPQLRLQDLNKHDIQQATSKQLGTVLEESFPQLKQKTTDLVNEVVSRSQGIFLWVNLIIRDLKTGLRNEDNIEELRERLDGMPDTVHGVYKHMLNRLDKSYRRQATEYFRFLMAVQEPLTGESSFTFPRLTLLHFACANEKALGYNLSEDRTHFQSSEFRESCRRLETRIITRCAGLVEIDESRMLYLEGIVTKDDKLIAASQREENVSRYLREVKFIHKTVVEFLRSRADFFQDPNWQASATLAVIRSQLRVASLTPIIISRKEPVTRPITLNREFVRQILYPGPTIKAAWPVQEDGRELPLTASQLVDQAYNLWDYVTRSHDEPEDSVSMTHDRYNFVYTGYNYFPTLRGRLGFAAFFGCYDYVSQHIAIDGCSQKELDFLLSCAVLGIHDTRILSIDMNDLGCKLLSSFFNIVLELLPRSSDPNMYIEVDDSHKHDTRYSKWQFFIQNTFRIAELVFWSSKWPKNPAAQRFPQLSSLFKDVLTSFLDHNADVNVSIVSAILFKSTWPALGAVDRWSFNIKETAMNYIMRLVKSQNIPSTEGIEDLFKSRGGLQRRSICSLYVNLERLDLTLDQSERLLKELPWLGLGTGEVGILFDPDHPYCKILRKPRPVEPTAGTEEAVNEVIRVLKEWYSKNENAYLEKVLCAD